MLSASTSGLRLGLPGRVLLAIATTTVLCPVGDASPTEGLVWIVADEHGEVIDQHGPDEPIPDATAADLMITEWMLANSGADHRFATRFGIVGTLERHTGTLAGDLVVDGGLDPDFQLENAWLVARALHELGVRRVTGALLVDREFWFAGGVRPAVATAERLAGAWDPDSWNRTVRRRYRRLLDRHGWKRRMSSPIAVARVGVADGQTDAVRWLVEHESNGMATLLKRFNGATDPTVVRELLARRGARLRPTADRDFTTASELLRLVEQLDRTASNSGVRLHDVLTVPGCDLGCGVETPCPSRGRAARALAVAGDVGTLAGSAATVDGRRFFVVSAVRQPRSERSRRRAIQRWLAAFLEDASGPDPTPCDAAIVTSDVDALVRSSSGS